MSPGGYPIRVRVYPNQVDPPCFWCTLPTMAPRTSPFVTSPASDVLQLFRVDKQDDCRCETEGPYDSGGHGSWVGYLSEPDGVPELVQVAGERFTVPCPLRDPPTVQQAMDLLTLCLSRMNRYDGLVPESRGRTVQIEGLPRFWVRETGYPWILVQNLERYGLFVLPGEIWAELETLYGDWNDQTVDRLVRLNTRDIEPYHYAGQWVWLSDGDVGALAQIQDGMKTAWVQWSSLRDEPEPKEGEQDSVAAEASEAAYQELARVVMEAGYDEDRKNRRRTRE